MIIMSDTTIEPGTVLVNSEDNSDWIVIRFDSCEDPYFSQATVISISDIAEAISYINMRYTTYYPFNNFKSLQYISGNEWDDWEETANMVLKNKYKDLFKPVQTIKFNSKYIPKGGL